MACTTLVGVLNILRRASLQVLATNCNGFHAGSDGFEVGHHLGPTVGIAGVGGVETQSLDDVAVARPKLGCDGFGLADDRKRIEDLIIDERAHLVPRALLR